MANPIYEVLDTQGMSLTVFCGGQSRVGIRLFGTWTGTVSFYASQNGVAFVPVYVTPFASGTAVSTATANGNWFLNVGDWVAVKVVFTTLTTGTLSVAMCSAVDSSWQNAFLAATSIYVNSEASGNNTLTQAAQTNRAWNLQQCFVSLAGSMPPQGNVSVVVYDGSISGTVIWKEFLETSAGSLGSRFTLNLPTLTGSGTAGITGTPGNAMTIQLLGVASSVKTEINAKFSPA